MPDPPPLKIGHSQPVCFHKHVSTSPSSLDTNTFEYLRLPFLCLSLLPLGADVAHLVNYCHFRLVSANWAHANMKKEKP